MVVLFTGNIDGAMVQMSIHLLKEFHEMGIEARCFLPEQAIASIPDELSSYTIRYRKGRTFSKYSRTIRDVVRKIINLKPDLVFYVDNSIIACQTAQAMGGKAKQVITFHDAGDNHPTSKTSLKQRMHDWFEESNSVKAASLVDNVLVMSHESEDKYKHNYPATSSKLLVLPLGAHIPDVTEQAPPESLPTEFFLFFGRIDKYKGIGNLLSACASISELKIPLVIAGKGNLSDNEVTLLNKTKTILLNRYIKDEEMIWLFKKAKFVVLPYIQATQSGIIPIAYSFGKPVITSDVEGLTQFVVNRRTGIICSNAQDYQEAITYMSENDLKSMSIKCKEYYNTKLDWKANLQVLFRRMDFEI